MTIQILVTLETEGDVTPEAVRSNVHQAVHHWRNNAGLSSDEDEGYVTAIDTEVFQ